MVGYDKAEVSHSIGTIRHGYNCDATSHARTFHRTFENMLTVNALQMPSTSGMATCLAAWTYIDNKYVTRATAVIAPPRPFTHYNALETQRSLLARLTTGRQNLALRSLSPEILDRSDGRA
jgi:hypothetical protein